MSRRDTILVAILINAGLLVILFATAVSTDKSDSGHVVQLAEMPREVIAVAPPARTVVADEVDEVLRQYEEQVAVVEEPAHIVEVTVKRGDTLDKIAKGNGTTVDAIMRASQLSDSRLQIGQVLKVPASEEPIAVVQPEPVVSEELYEIQSGDNPWTIAMKHHIPLDQLLKINDLNEDKARKLKPGDQIRIR